MKIKKSNRKTSIRKEELKQELRTKAELNKIEWIYILQSAWLYWKLKISKLVTVISWLVQSLQYFPINLQKV